MSIRDNPAFAWHFNNFAMYILARTVVENPQDHKEELLAMAQYMLPQQEPLALESMQFLQSLQEEERQEVFAWAEDSETSFDFLDPKENPIKESADKSENLRGVPIHEIFKQWAEEYLLFLQTEEQTPRKKRAAPRGKPQDMMSVHSSSPVYDIGETIARGAFLRPQGGRFPQARIVGSTEGRIEILPFWDHATNQPLTPQRINLVAQSDLSEFESMQEEAMRIATSYNEEMATYFYAMDAYWLMTAKSPADFVQLEISELLQYSGKKPVKTHGKYTGSYRPDQLQRAGMMVYGMGFSMVEIEKTIIKGVGERSHFKRLWEVSDMYIMKTLDSEKYIESMTYRPNEFMRNVSFGSRRETALLMSKVLSLDYAKMVTARRLGRYFTWLWRDRAYRGNMDAPITCTKLMERAGVTVEKGNERYARRKLETALDRLETEGIIAQWVLLQRNGSPADLSERIPFSQWMDMRIAVSPPDVIVSYYTGSIELPGKKQQKNALEIGLLRKERKRRGYTLAQLSEETGIDISTLSRIEAGRTKRPRAEFIAALQAWLKQSLEQNEQEK